MKNNTNTTNLIPATTTRDIQTPVYSPEKPTSLKNNWITESMENIKYYGNIKEIKEVYKSKGKSIVIMNDGSIVGYRNFPPTESTCSQEHVEYLRLTLDTQKAIIPENTEEKKRINLIAGLLSGSEGVFGRSFIACKSITGKSGRNIAKVNQKEIASKLENLLNKKV